jgi:acyl-CoA reductase-like NAD-dependent aldehyde dehydrogenase
MDGRWMEDGDVVEVRAPFDGSVIARVIQARREHAEAAIAAAVKAFGTTRRLPAFERQRVLRRVAQSIAERRDEFPALWRRKPGSPSSWRASKLTARSSFSTSPRKRPRAFTANISPSTGRNRPPDAGAS